MSIHKLNLVIYLSLSVALCGQVIAQDGSGTATPLHLLLKLHLLLRLNLLLRMKVN